jgi:hypothetical protein
MRSKIVLFKGEDITRDARLSIYSGGGPFDCRAGTHDCLLFAGTHVPSGAFRHNGERVHPEDAKKEN